jgi:hypothetical protein
MGSQNTVSKLEEQLGYHEWTITGPCNLLFFFEDPRKVQIFDPLLNGSTSDNPLDGDGACHDALQSDVLH